MNEWKVHIFLTINLCIRKKPGYSLQQFNTHGHFGHLISLSGKSHIIANAAYLARG